MTSDNHDIVLLGINARYRHTSFGLRYLKANLGDLASQSVIVETTISQLPMRIVEEVMAHNPVVVGLGVYVWNTTLCLQVAQLLKAIRPDIHLILGGPEISHETESQLLFNVADTIVCGEGDIVFRQVCQDILDGHPPVQKVIQGSAPPMDAIVSPYGLYTDDDLANRVTYVEASRGCPYRCQFCLSSIDTAVRTVDSQQFFVDMDRLIERGARDFKFIDRTFNLNIDFALSIINFFLHHDTQGFTLHFEMVPDRLPEALRDALSQFPPGVVQLEIGIQTFNADVSKRIQRPQRLPRIVENLRFLREHTEMYLHVDLIVGLPGESLASFGDGFDRLVALEPHEIQVGILKRLKGTPIVVHDKKFEMKYSPLPPFEILSSAEVTFEEVQEMKRFAKYWDLVVNGGQFQRTVPMIWANQPSAFDSFRMFSNWLFERLGRTSHINLSKLAEYLFDFLVCERGFGESDVGPIIVSDLNRTGGRNVPQRLRLYQSEPAPPRVSAFVNGGRERQERRY